jgi:curved DNA-binding protein CbpA
LKTYYELLSVAPGAPADEIKKAFRREIARYHPDKVQHLGAEFQQMAAGIAADLTEAYRILMDPALRAKYDQQIAGSDGQPSAAAPPAATHPAPPPPPPDDPTFTSPAPPPPRPGAGLDFIKRAAISKIREAIEDVLSGPSALPATGFDIALATTPKKALFRKAEESICLLVRFVPHVDGAAVTDAWIPASRVRAPSANGCVLMLVGQGMASSAELSAAVTEQRRKARTPGGPVVVPVDVRDWDALFPPETPGAVRALIQRLKDEKR